MKIIIIPPKKARVKIKGIHGFALSIQWIIIIIAEKTKIDTIIITGDIFTMKNIDLRMRIFLISIQNLVYLKS